MRILGKLNEAEAFETFLQTKYVGQKRFSLEGGESTISLLDTVIQDAAHEGLEEVVVGMAHRGRLNVLTNIAGKTYGQIFREFEGTQDPRTVQGSGDVKYHLGTEGTFTSADGKQIPVYIAANPSHLEAVDGVMEGIVRAKQDRHPIGTFKVLPIMVHGDAAMAGQGIVDEVLQMSQLRAYRTGGTVHVNINNQVGFTTPPGEGRTSVYSTDVAKTIQCPIFHVNGDDPEAVMRVAHLAFQYRQEFKRDVVIDLVCYRRRGHNEGDDPSMTQPLMYNLIEAKRSVRTLYTEALVGRGDITEEEYDAAHRGFQDSLERAFAETHAAQTGSMPIITDAGAVADLERPGSQQDDAVGEPETTAIAESVVQLIGDAHDNPPAGFAVHPKLQALLKKRLEMSRSGQIDWGFGELIALGSLLLEGTPVRMAARTPGAAPSSSGTRCCTTGSTARSGCRSRTSARRRRGSGSTTRCSASTRQWDSSTAIRSSGRMPSCSGRRSSAISPTAPRSSSISSSRRPSRSGDSARASSCCCRTATRARGRTTPRRASNASCSCARRTT